VFSVEALDSYIAHHTADKNEADKNEEVSA
jgi:hypothetical protein